jgi:hypothetical protein
VAGDIPHHEVDDHEVEHGGRGTVHRDACLVVGDGVEGDEELGGLSGGEEERAK